MAEMQETVKTQDATSKKGNGRAWSALIGMCIMCVVWTGIGWNTITLYADPIITEWGVLRSQFMVAVSILGLANALGSLFVYGPVESKLGIRKIVLIGGLSTTIGTFILAAAQNLVMLYIGALLFGIGLIPLNTNTLTLVINNWFKKRMATYISIPQTCGSVAGIIFAIVYAWLIATLGWRIPFIITACLTLVGTVLILVLYKGSPEEVGGKAMYADEVAGSSATDAATDTTATTATVAPEEDGISFKKMFSTPQFYLLLVGYLMVGLCAYGVFSNLVLFVTDWGYGDLVGTVLSTALFASAIAMIPYGLIGDKFGTKWMVTIGMALIIIAMVILQMPSAPLWVAYVVGALVGAAYDSALLAASISVKEAFGTKEYGKKVGIIVAFDFIGISVAPTIMSLFYDMTGSYNSALIVFIVMAALSIVMIFPGTRRAHVK